MGKVNLRLAIARPESLGEIHLRRIPEQGYFLIELGSPVIEFDRCYFDGTILRRGRIYFRTGPGLEPAFVQWANKVLRSVRSELIKDSALGPHYYGPAARDWLLRTGAQERIGWNELVAGPG
jgi:hypothetical protein